MVVGQVIDEGGMYQLSSNLEHQEHILNVYSYSLLGFPSTVSSIKSFGNIILPKHSVKVYHYADVLGLPFTLFAVFFCLFL